MPESFLGSEAIAACLIASTVTDPVDEGGGELDMATLCLWRDGGLVEWRLECLVGGMDVKRAGLCVAQFLFEMVSDPASVEPDFIRPLENQEREVIVGRHWELVSNCATTRLYMCIHCHVEVL